MPDTLKTVKFDSWLESYGTAWEQGDPERAGKLFDVDAQYYETPFSEALKGRNAIKEYWDTGPGSSQQDVLFDFHILSFKESLGIAHWTAEFTRKTNGARVKLDGILSARFNDQGKCVLFREWWHSEENTE